MNDDIQAEPCDDHTDHDPHPWEDEFGTELECPGTGR